ncbi:unnamed protein product [Adineta steineri]|uniref:Oxysterol-binding protein n=1 Tax=Adineta steineri TaxID=433720 RepID=A0A819IMB7_9BILA|nr:unnamed protein product [Adineta steineri]CAF3918600.1 unnamed protein product [Adineta steineri]
MTVDLRASRRILPAPMIDRSSYSIFSVIKQAIGKDLTKFSIPVVWNEPLSFLQRLAECIEYSSLLDQAALTNIPVERFHLLTAFIVSTLSTNLERMSKPFNPLLGETYELKMEGDTPFHYISEQVSHHPPVSALYIRGQHWTLSANVEPKVKFQGTNVVAVSEGRWILRIKKIVPTSRSASQSSFQSCTEEDDEQNSNVNNHSDEEDEYTWTSPSIFVHNILFGRLWCEFQGEFDLQHTQSNQRSVLTIKTQSWLSSQSTKTANMFKYTGFIYDGKDKLGAFHGNYGHCYYAIDNLEDTQFKSSSSSCCSAGGHNCIHINTTATVSSPCDLILTPSSRLIWFRSLSLMNDNELALRSQYYFFTPFALCLNEQVSSVVLPLTDSRHRQDIQYLEKGNTDAAAAEKHRLEEQQRADARKRDSEHQPLWFKKDENEEYIYTNEYDKRQFNHCPNLFSSESCE